MKRFLPHILGVVALAQPKHTTMTSAPGLHSPAAMRTKTKNDEKRRKTTKIAKIGLFFAKISPSTQRLGRRVAKHHPGGILRWLPTYTRHNNQISRVFLMSEPKLCFSPRAHMGKRQHFETKFIFARLVAQLEDARKVDTLITDARVVGCGVSAVRRRSQPPLLWV